MDERVSRRDFLQGGAVLGVIAVVGTVGCGKEKKVLSCTDTMSLSTADAQVRTSLGYVDHSGEPLKTCLGCQHFILGPPDTCGSCKVVKGPINPAGYCRSFLAKPT